MGQADPLPPFANPFLGGCLKTSGFVGCVQSGLTCIAPHATTRQPCRQVRLAGGFPEWFDVNLPSYQAQCGSGKRKELVRFSTA